MTTTFDKREEGFEKEFVHDEDLRFKAMSRRNKMLGLWAAAQLGKSGADAEAYAKEVVLAEFAEGKKESGADKVIRDLAGKVTAAQVEAQMDLLFAQAFADVKKSG